MSGFLESEVDEYLTSQYFLFLEPQLKEHALSILTSFVQGCSRAGIESASAMSIDKLDSVMTAATLHLDIDAASRKRAPHLIQAFFEYLDTSGRVPGASVWAGWTATLAARHASRIRDDGTVRGETYTQKAAPVNRNDPCPCGSGKKFKKCCMGLLG